MRKGISLIFTILLLIQCSEPELTPKNYPYVVMREVNTLNSGVEFDAEFMGLGDTPVKRYGFLWWEGTSDMDSTNFWAREMEGEAAVGSFTLAVTSDLAGGASYQVRPFAENSFSIVLGDVMHFESNGTNSPELVDFFPTSGVSGDIITINGANFSLSASRVEVFVGEDKGILLSTDANQIIFKLPAHLSKSGKVSLTVKSGDKTVVGKDMFLIEGHSVTDFNPKKGIIGETEVVISGVGFLSSGNNVYIGGNKATILSETDNQIKVRLPYRAKAGIFDIDVEVNGQSAKSESQFELRSRWVRLSDFPGAARLDAFSTVVGDFMYLIGGDAGYYSAEVWKYDILRDSWEQLPDFPGGGRSGGVGFSIGEMVYYGLGIGSADDFWSFNTVTEEWNETYSLSSFYPTPLSATIDGLGYIITGNAVWTFAEETGWKYYGIQTNISISALYDSYLEVDGHSYIINLVKDGTTNCDIYELRSSTGFWKLIDKIPFPEKDYNGVYFSSHNYAYLGEGVHDDEHRQLLRYDVNSGELVRVENFQGQIIVRGAVSFTYDNKGFVGFGLFPKPDNFGGVGYSNEFWMYDPSIE